MQTEQLTATTPTLIFHICLPSHSTNILTKHAIQGVSPFSLSLSPFTSHKTNLLHHRAYTTCGWTRLLSAIARKHRHREWSDKAAIGGMISGLTGTLCADTAMLSGWAITFTQRSMSVAKRKVSSALWHRSFLEHLWSERDFELKMYKIVQKDESWPANSLIFSHSCYSYIALIWQCWSLGLQLLRTEVSRQLVQNFGLWLNIWKTNNVVTSLSFTLCLAQMHANVSTLMLNHNEHGKQTCL